MMECLNQYGVIAVDTFFKNNQYHPITYADLDPECGLYENCLTIKDDHGSRQTLDYIFECYFKESLEKLSENKRKIHLDSNGFRIEKFLVENDGCKKAYTQLSDHYGLSCELVYQSICLFEFKFLESDENVIDDEYREIDEETKPLL